MDDLQITYEELYAIRAERDALRSLVDRALELFIQYQTDMDGHPDYEYKQFLTDIEEVLEGGERDGHGRRKVHNVHRAARA